MTAIPVQPTLFNSDHPSGSVSIHLESIADGHPSYQFAIGDSEYQSSLQFSDLYPGIYQLHVKDFRECIAENTEVIEVPEKTCILNYQRAFNPSIGETWIMAMEALHFGKLNIFDREGILRVSLSIRQGQPSVWDGRDDTGQILSMGSYIFVLVNDYGMC